MILSVASISLFAVPVAKAQQCCGGMGQDGAAVCPMAATNAPAKPYPLKTCLVSGDKIGEMGVPPKLVYKGQEIKFCCKDCIKDFNKDPEKYMKKLAAEEKKLAAEKK